MMWIILQRELWIRLRDFRFWIGVLSLPLLIGAVLGVTALLKREKPPISVYLVGADELAPLLTSAPRFKFIPIDSAVAPQRKATLQEGEALLELTERAPTHLVLPCMDERSYPKRRKGSSDSSYSRLLSNSGCASWGFPPSSGLI